MDQPIQPTEFTRKDTRFEVLPSSPSVLASPMATKAWIVGPKSVAMERPPTKGRSVVARKAWERVRALWKQMLLVAGAGSAEATADYGGSTEQMNFHSAVRDAGVLNLGCYRNTKPGRQGLVRSTSDEQRDMLGCSKW